MATHTPGPWRISDDDPRVVQVADEDSWDTRRVCSIANTGDLPRDVATARLIAEAPSLLAACRAVLASETWHDHKGHAYLRVDARSIYDLAAQIQAVVQHIDSNHA